jgi:hypothetical protein
MRIQTVPTIEHGLGHIVGGGNNELIRWEILSQNIITIVQALSYIRSQFVQETIG